MKQLIKKYWPFFPIGLFLLIKLVFVEYRFGDGNAYPYMAQRLWEGAIPYQDYFLADMPGQILWLMPWVMVFGDWALGYYLLPIFLAALNSFQLLYLAKERYPRWSSLLPGFYLLSFTLFSTVDYASGAQLTTAFVLLGLNFLVREKFWWSGMALAMACLVKLYAAPVVIVIGLLLVWRRQWQAVMRFILGGLVWALVITLPFIILSGGEFFNDTIFHHFNRPPGINKVRIFTFFLKVEWWWLLSGLAGLYLVFKKKQASIIELIASFSVGSLLLFYLLFQDLYYMYLMLLLPLLLILAGNVWQWLEAKQIENSLLLVGMIWLGAVLLSQYQYWRYTYYENLFPQADQVAAEIKSLPQGEIYGTHEATPLLAQLLGRKTVDNYIDTNTQAFGSGAQDIKVASQKVVEAEAYLVARRTYLPQLSVDQVHLEGYFDRTQFEAHCQQKAQFETTQAVTTNNSLVLYRCAN